MATRKIIDIERNGEKVWPKGHAKATFMSDGSTVEDAINSIQTGSGEGCIVSEIDPLFSASPAAGITAEQIREWNAAVDNFENLSESSGVYAAKVDNLEAKVKAEETTPNTIVERDEHGGIWSKFIGDENAVYAFPNSSDEDKQFADAVLATTNDTGDLWSEWGTLVEKDKELAAALEGKVDKVTLATVATSGSYNDLSDKPTIPSAVTESTVSGWGFTKNAGTVTGVKINGTTYSPSSGVVDLGTISGGGSSDSGSSGEQYVDETGRIVTLQHNTLHRVWITSGGVKIISAGDLEIGQTSRVVLCIISGSPSITLQTDANSDIYWANDNAPDISELGTYEISFTNIGGADKDSADRNKVLGVWTKY